jgi:cellulose synthase/poly-beta-1,6-N-acetylglucosamine synthase-like glycosyltransferase
MDKKYDAVCIFDADNLVHPNFLKEMNSRLCHGEKIIQGYLDTKNPEDSWDFSHVRHLLLDHEPHLASGQI